MDIDPQPTVDGEMNASVPEDAAEEPGEVRLEEDEDSDDEDREDPADVAMVPMADMLNARFESENVRTTTFPGPSMVGN